MFFSLLKSISYGVLIGTLFVSQFLILVPQNIALAADCSPQWNTIAVPKAQDPSSMLTAISASDPEDVWAVGRVWGSTGSVSPFVEHWDGYAWKIVPLTQYADSGLTDIHARRSNDVWAVGSSPGNQLTDAFILQWNGTSWKQHIFSSKLKNVLLNGVYARTAKDVWAIGVFYKGNRYHALTIHYDGLTWKQIEFPIAPNEQLGVWSIHARAENDVWLVGTGYTYDPINDTVQEYSLTAHYDGSMWTRIQAPDLGNHYQGLSGVVAVSANNIWAVGRIQLSKYYAPILLHNDGTGWSEAEMPTLPGYSSGLISIAQVPENPEMLVARGWYIDEGSHGSVTLVWNGSTWQMTTQELAGNPYQSEYDTAILSENEYWSVGQQEYSTRAFTKPLSRHYAVLVAAPKLLSPRSNATLDKTRVTLEWQAADCALRYELRVTHDSKTGAAVISQTALSEVTYKTAPLASGHTYFWQVRGCRDDTCGKWSKFYKFTLQ